MSNSGLYIKEFEARGKNVPISSLTFYKGCNVVLGKSDTGKTTLYSIIDFVFGKGNADLTLPPEGDGYTDFFLEIHTYDERIYTLRRSISSMSVFVYQCSLSEYNEQQKPTEYSCQGASNINISDFLLSVSNVPTIYSKSSETKNPTKISYSIIRHLYMVDETRVAAKDRSPLIFNIIPNQQWVEKNLIAYLMTGIDDSEFRPNDNPSDKKSRINGKIEYLSQTIKEEELKLQSLGDVGFISLTDDCFIETYRNKLAEVASAEETLYNNRELILGNIREYEKERKKLDHLIARLDSLKVDYEEEMSRLQFINSGNSLIHQLKDVDCPLCGSTIAHHMIADISTSEYANAIKNEYNEIYYKCQDLNALIKEKKNELDHITASIEEFLKQKKNIDVEISILHPDLTELKEILTRAESNLNKKFIHDELEEDIKTKKILIKKLQEELKSIKNNNKGQRQDISTEFLNLVKENLVLWNFINENVEVNFNYQKYDILIGGRHRSSYGKGNRSITFTAVMIALLDYCYNNERAFSRLLIIDSPLCTKYGDKNVSEEEQVTFGTIDAFARYCNMKEWNFQFIVIDNKFTENISIEELANINFIDLETRGGLFRQHIKH